MDHETNQAGAPQDERTAAAAAAPQAPKKVRRVGTFAFGLTLIAAGVLLVARILMPSFDIVTAAKFAPVILIVLGAEVLIYAARPDVKLKYDFLSMFACAFILVCVGTASVLPQIWDYYGPARQYQQRRFTLQLESETQAALANVPGGANLIRDAHFSLWNDELVNSSITDLHEVDDVVEVTAYFTMARTAGGAEKFAGLCKSVMDACNAAGVPIDEYSFTTRNDSVYESGMLEDYRLSVSNVWFSGADLETLAASVQVSWWCDGTYFDTKQQCLDWLAEREAERVAATAETALTGEGYDSAYDEGYADGYESGWQEAATERAEG